MVLADMVLRFRHHGNMFRHWIQVARGNIVFLLLRIQPLRLVGMGQK